MHFERKITFFSFNSLFYSLQSFQIAIFLFQLLFCFLNSELQFFLLCQTYKISFLLFTWSLVKQIQQTRGIIRKTSKALLKKVSIETTKKESSKEIAKRIILLINCACYCAFAWRSIFENPHFIGWVDPGANIIEPIVVGQVERSET